MKKIYIFLIIIYIFVLAYWYYPIQANSKIISDAGKIDIYLCQEINCSFILTQLIEKSNESKCVFFDLNEPNVVNTLIQASNNKNNEILLFKDNFKQEFENKFISVNSKGLMHHKFCVFDKQIILTGSWNPTIRGTYHNDNLIVLIYSSQISKAYLNEFKRIKTGKTTQSNYKFNLSGSIIDLCFSPQGNCEKLIIETILNAKNEIKFLTFTFTSQNIANTILNKNISYYGVIEKSQKSKYTVDLTYSFDTNKYNMHHKTFIIDDDIIITGSYNPTKGANEKNDENLLVIENNELNTIMKKEFNRIYLNTT